MPNFLSLFTWNFCLPFKYCLKASNYTVCFILRYLILQYRYNRYPIPMSAIFYQKLIIIGVVVLSPKITWQKNTRYAHPPWSKPWLLSSISLWRGGGGYVPWFGHSPLWLGRILQEKLGQWGCCSSHIPVFFYLKDLWVNVILFFFNYRSYSSAYAYPPRR